MNFKGIMLSERGQFQKVTYSMNPFTCHSSFTKRWKYTVTENIPVVAKGEGYMEDVTIKK